MFDHLCVCQKTVYHHACPISFEAKRVRLCSVLWNICICMHIFCKHRVHLSIEVSVCVHPILFSISSFVHAIWLPSYIRIT